MDTPIQGLFATTKIKGIGLVKWCICDFEETSTSIETTAYFIPEADTRLSSPQAYFDENKTGSFVMDSIGTVLTLPNLLSLYFDYHNGNNLPMATCSEMEAAVCMVFDASQVEMFQTLLLKNIIKTSLKLKRNCYNGIGN